MKKILRRLWEQTVQVLSDSWQQAARLSSYAAGLWRQRELRQATRSAAECLGEAAYQGQCGDLALREQVMALDVEIKRAIDEKRPTYRLGQERRVFVQSLGLSILTDPTEPLAESVELRNTRVARDAVAEHEALVNRQRSTLFPSGFQEARNILLGYGVIGSIAFSAAFLFIHSRSTTVPVVQNRSDLSPEVAGVVSDLEQESAEIRQELEAERQTLQEMADQAVLAGPHTSPMAPSRAVTSESTKSVPDPKHLAVPEAPAATAIPSPPSATAADALDPPDPPGNFQNSKQSLLKLSQLAGEILMKDGEFSQEGAVLLAEIAETAATIGDYKTVSEIEGVLKKVPGSLSPRTAPFLCDLAAGNAVISGLHDNLDDSLHYLQKVGPQPQSVAKGFGGAAVAFGQSTRPGDADQVFAALEKVVTETPDSAAKIRLLTVLGKTQSHLGLLRQLSQTNDQLVKLWHDSRGQNSRLIADAKTAIAVALAEGGDFESAEQKLGLLEDLFPNSEHQAVARHGIAVAHARSLNFRDALLTAAKIKHDVTRCQCLLAIHAQVVAVHPLFDDLALKLADEMLLEVPKLRGKPGFAEIECQAMVNSVVWEREEVAERYTHSSAAPSYRIRAMLALAEYAAQRDEGTTTESYLAQALEQISEEKDAEKRRVLLIELGRVAFVCQAQKFLEEKIAGRDILLRGRVLLGLAKGLIAEDAIESAFSNRLLYAGTTEQPKFFFVDVKQNQTWEGFREQVQKTHNFGGGWGHYLYEKQPKLQVLAVSAAGGLDIAYPPKLAGFLGATKLFTSGYFEKSEIDNLGKVCDGPTNRATNIGRFTAEKRFLDQPAGWLVMKIRQAEKPD